MTILDALVGSTLLQKAKPSQLTELGAFSRMYHIAKTESQLALSRSQLLNVIETNKF